VDAIGPASRAGASRGFARFGVVRALGDIKVAHSVFAMPFALLAALLASDAPASAGGAGSWGVFAGQMALVAWCMVSARTWAMLVNRLADREMDAANPRTAGRLVASGRVGVGEALRAALVSAGLFLAGCVGFWAFYGNVWPTALGIAVLAWIALYSFTKRFTALCHLFLGGALAVSPLAAALAVRPEVYAEGGGTSVALYLLAGFVTLWVAGFDVAYALQDLAFDRERGLRSVPAALGWRGALWVSRGLHSAAAGLLVGVGMSEPRFGAVFGVGAAVVVGLLGIEHVVLARRGLAGLPMAFFTLNGIVSVALGVFAGIDVFV